MIEICAPFFLDDTAFSRAVEINDQAQLIVKNFND